MENQNTTWNQWISHNHTSPQALEAIREVIRQRPRAPIHLRDFLQPEQARRLQEALENLPLWTRVHAVVKNSLEIEELTQEEWLSRPEEKRWSRQDVARPLNALADPSGPLSADARKAMQDFFVFAMIGPVFRSWLAALYGVDFQDRGACEVVRYQPGDYIIPHADTHDERIVGINFYLGHDWQDGDGGELEFFNEHSDATTIRPLFNSISMIPIHIDCLHQVKPWLRSTPGRETICLSYRPVQPVRQQSRPGYAVEFK